MFGCLKEQVVLNMTRFKRVSAYTSGGLLRANHGLQSVGKKEKKKKVMQARRLLRQVRGLEIASQWVLNRSMISGSVLHRASGIVFSGQVTGHSAGYMP